MSSAEGLPPEAGQVLPYIFAGAEPAHGRRVQPELPAPGTRLGGYVLGEMLGADEVCVTYRAHHPNIAGPVTLEVVRPSVSRDNPSLPAQLTRWVHKAGPLMHPNLVRVYAHATVVGLDCLIREPVDGVTVAAMVARRGALPARLVWRMIGHVVAALEAAARVGLPAQVIDPTRVWLGVTGTTKLALAPRSGGLAGNSDLDADAQMRANLAALGEIGFLALTGGPAAVDAPRLVPAARSDLRIDISAVIARLRVPGHGFASYAEVKAALRSVAT